MKNLRQSLTKSEGVVKEPDQQSRATPELPAQRSIEKLNAAVKAEPAVRRVVQRAAKLSELITDDDRVRAKEVIREAMEATTRVYDKANACLDVQPDHKTRLAAATLQLAYDEGTPVKRSISITSDFRSADEIVMAIQSSPEAARALVALSGLGLTLEAGGEVINSLPDSVNSGEDATESDS